jgi:ubiquinone/menaquinone biosynthesis C-methylase UbiE
MGGDMKELDPPDIATSSDDYAKRFSREVGKWFLSVQAEGVRKLLEHLGASSLLEVGGGHAQLTESLMADSHRTVVQGSDPSCAVRLRRIYSSQEVPFVCSSLEQLPFDDMQFDIVVTVRTMAHVPDPRAFLTECCRVAKSAVLIDYPSCRSINLLGEMMFGLKNKVEKDTRPYRSFKLEEIAEIFRSSGFREAGSIPQFFWPMALHRFHKSSSLSRVLETIPRSVGFTHLLGSPILSLFKRHQEDRDPSR